MQVTSRAQKFFLAGAAASLLLSSGVLASGTFERENYRDVRLLGMGNAGIAFVDGGLSGFMNPAGISDAKGVEVKFVDASFAANQSFKDSYVELAPALMGGGGGETLSEKFAPFLGKPLGLQGSFLPYVNASGILMGVWDYFDFSFLYADPVYPRLDVSVRNDYGIILGTAKKFMDRISIGTSLRYQRRRFINQSFTADTLASGSLKTLLNALERGEGYGLNAGIQIRQPLSYGQTLGFGLAMEDIGQTRFRPGKVSNIEPDRQFQSLNAGLGYMFNSKLLDFKYCFDLHNLLDTEGSYTKKIFTGLEISLPTVDVRGGLYQGYWTLGLTLRLFPLLDIDFTSYAEELGASASQKQNRWYLMGFRFGMDVNAAVSKGKKKQKYTLDRFR